MKIERAYKQTEVGVIPDDWNLMMLKDIAKYRRGSFPQPYGLSKWYDDVFGKPFIQVFDVDDNMKLKPETKKRLSNEAEKMSVFAKKGSVVVTINGSLGRVALTQYDGYIDRTLLIFENFFVPIDNQYFAYALSRIFQREKEKAPGAILKTITKEHLSNFLLPVPSLAEQIAIGEALSSVDAHLNSLDMFITKMYAIKSGAMQDLLKGKRRLPGFEGEWEEKRLGEHAELNSGGTPPSSVTGYYGGSIPWVTISDMTKRGKYICETDRNLSGKGLANSSAKLFPPGTVLYAMYASIGECSIATVDLCTSQAILGIRPKPNLNNYYLYFHLVSRKEEIKVMGQQGTQANLNAGMVKDFKIPFPPIKEQIAIATVLSDMDVTINALEQQREKTCLIKHGMLQELLTGKTRLV